MNKRTKYIIIAIILIIAVIAGIIIIRNAKEDSFTVNGDTTLIKSTESHPIIKEGIEASTVELKKTGSDLEVSTLIKNTTNEDIKGYYIEIHLLDKNGETITMVAENSSNTIKAGEDYLFKSSVAGLEKDIDVADAKIGALEKNTLSNN